LGEEVEDGFWGGNDQVNIQYLTKHGHYQPKKGPQQSRRRKRKHNPKRGSCVETTKEIKAEVTIRQLIAAS